MSTEKLTKSEREQLELGKKLQAFYEMGYVDKKSALLFSVLKGMAGGFGAFVGGTLVIALLLWGLSSLKEVPLVGPVTRQVQKTLQKN